MSTQLTFGLSLRDDATFSNFYCTEENRLMLTHLKSSAIGRGERFIYLWGNQGVGRSHLLQASCQSAHQVGLTSLYLPLNELQTLQCSILDGLEALHLICVDDFQKIAGNREWEVAFLDFYNRMQEAHKRLVVAADAKPKTLALGLPDLVSRLSSGSMHVVHGLSDEQKMEALILRANARGMRINEEVAKFLFRRFPRDMRSLFDALNTLDRASLAAQRKITIPFVKEILGL
ncbi:MAG: DnaA regulatory inactivator Hda [Gammaproteobacteria bacterium]|nr:DnaA regulatory inactivator Hda [Gammaproteobacteria bacterium]